MFESFRESPPSRQIMVVALAAATICALLFAAYFVFAPSPYGVLFSKLRSMDAATIVTELDKSKIPYRLERDGTTILVPLELVDTTRLSLMSQDMPLKGMVGFELFNKSDMGLTEFAQKINYQRALQGELARTIMTMETVESARIHLSIAEPTIFRGDRLPSKASVTVQPRGGRRITADTVRGIQRLVAASVPELDPANVVVLDGDGKVVSSGPGFEDQSAQGATGKRAVELYYEGQVRRALSSLYPAGDLEVRVWAAPSAPATAPLDAGSSPGVRSPGAIFDRWTPANRDFRLYVTIGLGAPVNQGREEEIRALTEAAIGTDESFGDTVTVSVSSAASQPLPDWNEAPGSALTSPLERDGEVRGGIFSTFNLALFTAILALLVAAYVARSRTRRRTLSEQQRSNYISRFKHLLEKGEADAAPPV